MASNKTISLSRVPSEDQPFLLTKVLSVMRDHLNFQDIGMWMVQENVISLNEHENIVRIKNSLSEGKLEKSQAVTEIANIVQKKGTLNQFISALRKSSEKEIAHKPIIEAIEEELQAREVDAIEKDEAVRKKRTDKQHSLEKNESKSSVKDETDQGSERRVSSTKEPLVPTDDTTATTAKRRRLGLVSRLLLLLMVPVVAAIGLIFIVYSIRGFAGKESCRITEESALEAFNFIFGLICLAVPTVFALLVIIGICRSYLLDNFWCTSAKCIGKLISFTVLFVIVVFIVAIVELIYSIFIAVQTYGHFDEWREEFRKPPTQKTLNCTRAVFISTFVSLTIYYVIMFVGFSALFIYLVGHWIKTTIDTLQENYVQDLVARYILCCIDSREAASENQTKENGDVTEESTQV